MSQDLQKEYQIGAELGRGRFGIVRRCVSVTSGAVLAVKSVDKTLLSDDLDRHLITLEPKLSLLASAASPHVLPIHAVFEDPSAIHIVMDLCAAPDLFQRISHGPFPEHQAAAILRPLISALAACHRHGIAHRDVKPDNVLFDEDGNLRLADFGSAAWFGDGEMMSGIVGTAYYAAPEVVAGREYTEKVDVWSAGVVLYMMLSGARPFSGETVEEVFEKVLRGNLRFPVRLFSNVSPAAKDLIRKMVCKDVGRRFSADQVLRHPWMSNGGT